MSTLRFLLILTLPCMFFACKPLDAQDRHYRLELTDGTSGHVALVNEAHKPIEAFHFSGSCGAGGSESTYDSLDYPGGANSRHAVKGPNGRTISQAAVLDSSGSIPTAIFLPAQPSGCAWQADIDAVVYADGSYEGVENSVKRLQVRRDGMAAAVNYWADRFDRESTEALKFASTIADTERIASDDKTRVSSAGAHRSDLELSYWSGRRQVDASLLFRGQQSKNGPEAKYRSMVNLIHEWRAKIAADAALKRIDLIFPVPIAIREQEPAVR